MTSARGAPVRDALVHEPGQDRLNGVVAKSGTERPLHIGRAHLPLGRPPRAHPRHAGPEIAKTREERVAPHGTPGQHWPT
jgi:hypothetical protein